MRTTLAIDDDVLMAAKAIAEQQDRSLGDVISDLARKPQAPAGRNGIPLLGVPAGTPPVALETVNALRDELP
jgi:hypothetical protein